MTDHFGHGAIATNLPPAELKARGYLNERARAADRGADSSRWIRRGGPGLDA